MDTEFEQVQALASYFVPFNRNAFRKRYFVRLIRLVLVQKEIIFKIVREEGEFLINRKKKTGEGGLSNFVFRRTLFYHFDLLTSLCTFLTSLHGVSQLNYTRDNNLKTI